MMATTIPAMVIAFLIYIGVGYFVIDTQSASFEKIEGITAALEDNFYISAWALLPALVVMLLALKKFPHCLHYLQG